MLGLYARMNKLRIIENNQKLTEQLKKTNVALPISQALYYLLV